MSNRSVTSARGSYLGFWRKVLLARLLPINNPARLTAYECLVGGGGMIGAALSAVRPRHWQLADRDLG